MEIYRQASRRHGAESLTVVPECQPQLIPDTNGQLALVAADSVAPRDDGSRYDYTVILTAADLALIRAFLNSSTLDRQ